METLAKLFIAAGILLALVGVGLLLLRRVPFLGRLPGDILIQRDGFTFYVPLVTFLVLSLGLTLLINFVLHLLKR